MQKPQFDLFRMLTSATFWNIALIFLTAGLNAITNLVPAPLETIVQLALGFSAYWQHSHPAQ
jgi:hypothetical protein